jgi:hypothetical protein
LIPCISTEKAKAILWLNTDVSKAKDARTRPSHNETFETKLKRSKHEENDNDNGNNDNSEKNKQTMEFTPLQLRKLNVMLKIRRMTTEGYSHHEIMQHLGLPRSTYFRYFSSVYQHDRNILEHGNTKEMLNQFAVAKDRLNDIYHSYYKILNSDNIDAKQRIEAGKTAANLAVIIAKTHRETLSKVSKQIPQDYYTNSLPQHSLEKEVSNAQRHEPRRKQQLQESQEDYDDIGTP